jgi:hypothetical protein
VGAPDRRDARDLAGQAIDRSLCGSTLKVVGFPEVGPLRTQLSALLLAVVVAGSAAAQDASSGLGQLHDDLGLTSDQESAWRDYAAAVAPDPQAEARRRATDELLPHIPTPRRIALIEASLAQDVADLRRQGQAVMGFYSRLTPDQQRTFDVETLPIAAARTTNAAAPR